MKDPETTARQPMGKLAHFGLSLLAVLVGLPISFGAFFVFGLILLFIVGAVLSASFDGGTSLAGKTPRSYYYAFGNPYSSNRLVSIPIYGPILSQSSASDPLQTIFGGGFTDGERVKEHLIDLANDPSVKGVILEIDSPGGLITASKAIADGAAAVRTKGKPIVAHVNGLGASGGYWVAASTDLILAEQGSEVGSIGVILGDIPYFKSIVTLGEISTAEPITIRSFSAGAGKDIGNPFRDMAPEEQSFIQELLNNEYNLFVSYISARRNIPEDTIRSTIKAYPYDTTRAGQLQLIDDVANKEDAYIELAKRSNVTDNFVVEREETSSGFFSSLFSAMKPQNKDYRSEARSRYCAGLYAKPLLLHGSLTSICRSP